MIVVAAKRLVERESCVVVVYKLFIQVRGENAVDNSGSLCTALCWVVVTCHGSGHLSRLLEERIDCLIFDGHC